MAPADARRSYTERCRKASLVGLPPDIRLPFASTLERVAGSSRPRQELVGVISQPSSTRALMLPELPGVSPRSNMDLPSMQISSLSFISFMSIFCLRTHSHRKVAKDAKESPGQKRKIENGEKILVISRRADWG